MSMKVIHGPGGAPVYVETDENEDGSVPSHQELEPEVVNAPITTAQTIQSTIAEYLSPAVLLAFFGVLFTWFASGTPFTWRALITVILAAIIAALQAVTKLTMNDPLGRMLRSTGQLNAGK